MALFELENGRLVPAQFGRDVPEGFTPEVLSAIRAQVLDIVSRPLFPIKWSAWHSDQPDQENSRLTALDASGQVVAVEVMRVLDADVLIDSLSKLADTAAMSWSDLAREYPLGPQGFKNEWIHFREAMPPSPPNGPRLVIAASQISEDIRPALDVLSSSGVEVHQMSLRQMANGRAFLEVDVVGPRLYGHRANTLLETSAVLPALTGSTEESRSEPAKQAALTPAPKAVAPAKLSPRTPARRASQDATPEPRRASRRQPSAQGPYPSRRTIHARRASEPVAFPTRRSLARRQPAATSSGASHAQRSKHGQIPANVGGEPQQAQLRKIAGAAGGNVLIFLEGNRGPSGATLQSDGVIAVPAGRFADPSAALEAQGFTEMDGWTSWRIGSPSGPTLLEALTEISL